MNEDQNQASEHVNTDSSSNNAHTDSDEPYNDSEQMHAHSSDDSGDNNTDGQTTMPSLKVDTDSSVQGRFWDSQCDNPDHSEPALPPLSD